MKSLSSKPRCECCDDKGYVLVKCLIEDYRRKCPCCHEEGGKKNENRGLPDLSREGNNR